MNNMWGKALKVFIGTSVLQVSSILNFIVLARLLTSQEFGNLRQLMLLNQVLFTVLFTAVPISLLYFCGMFSQVNEKKEVAYKHLVLIIICGLVCSLGIFTFRSAITDIFANNELFELLGVFFVFPVLYMLYNAVPTFLIALDRTHLIKWYCPAIAFVNTFFVLAAAWFGDFTDVFYTIILSAGFSAGVALLLLSALIKQSQPGVAVDPKRLSYRQIIGYSWFLVAAALISILGSKIDQFVISNKLGIDVFAIYVVGAFQIPIYSIIQSSVNSVMLPQITAHIANNEWNELRLLWRESVNKISLFALPLAAVLTVFSSEFITLVFGEQYRSASTIFLIFSLLAPIKCISFGLIFRASGKPQYDVIGASVFLILSSVFTLVGVSIWGPVGAAVGVVLATLLLACMMSLMVKAHTKGEIGVFDLIPTFFFYRFFGLLSACWIFKAFGEWVLS